MSDSVTTEMFHKIECPLGGRKAKPRVAGITMVMDKGMGLGASLELLQMADKYIDFIKLGFGTAALYPIGILQEKLAMINSYGIQVYPGGTFLEVAYSQGQVDEFLHYAKQVGFSAIEVSDGTVDMSPSLRKKIIRQAHSMGFTVITEVGKKDQRDEVSNQQLLQQINSDLLCGARYVIIEGRETGQGIGVYDTKGDIKIKDMDELLSGIEDLGKIIWEAPQKKQQVELINWFGPNINLGNIAPNEIFSLEALRRGLRGDTFRSATLTAGQKQA